MIRIRHRGNFSRTERFLNKVTRLNYLNILDQYGQEGVHLLSAATPVDTGKTASSWTYVIERNQSTTTIYWTNTNRNQGVSIAMILQYGHGTGNGGYVQGIDYINPAMRPLFEKMAEEAWKEVKEA